MQKGGNIRQIEGFPFYYASDLGYIYRCQCIINGKKYNSKIFGGKPWYHSDYLTVVLRNENGKFYHAIHRVIGKTFIPNPDNKPCINHKNRIRCDNRAENF